MKTQRVFSNNFARMHVLPDRDRAEGNHRPTVTGANYITGDPGWMRTE